MGHRDGIGRLDGQLGLVRTGVVDALHHILFCKVEHFLIGHIANGLAVHLHFQRIGLTDGVLHHCDHPGQCQHRQDVHGHARQGAHIAPHAADQIMHAVLYGCAKALFLPDAVRMYQQRAHAPEEQHNGPEQVAHHLGCTGERHGHDGMQQAAHPKQCTGHAPAHRASDTDKCIFGRKSQSVQGLTYDENEAVLQQLLRKMIDVMLGPAAEAVPTQELHALELCPQGAQLLAAFFRRLLRRLCGLRFLCLIFDQTGFSFLAARQSCSASGAAVVSTSCAAECQRTDDLCSFYYTPCTERNKHLNKIWAVLSRTFHESRSAISCGSGLSTVTVRPVPALTGVRMQMPSGTSVYSGTRKVCFAQCSACRPMRSRRPP